VRRWPRAQYAENKRDVEGHYLRAVELGPQLAERVRGGRRETRLVGTGDLPNAFRRPYGPGWALVGDAGYVRDPCTAQGITDSFLDAERLSDAAAKALGGKDFETPMGEYQRSRDAAVRPMFDVTCQLSAMKPLPLFMRAVQHRPDPDRRPAPAPALDPRELPRP
jgi:2-polyprenyl-6-methoxyphenol hydroxylase-like FAD-dependent oxidoreductase